MIDWEFVGRTGLKPFLKTWLDETSPLQRLLCALGILVTLSGSRCAFTGRTYGKPRHVCTSARLIVRM